MNTNNKSVIAVEQVSEIKSILTRKTSAIKSAGNLEAFSFIESQARLAKILAFKEIKESGEYKGIPYIDENGEKKFTQNMKEFCKYLLGESLSSLNEELQNINVLGQHFFEKTDHLKLGRKNLRLLRNAPEHERSVIIEKINNEEIDLNDKEAVKELLEDITEKHNQEKADLTQKLTESTQIANARKKLVETNAALLEDQIKKNDILEANQKAPKTDWAKVVHEINLECTKLAALAIEQMDKLMALNERIIAEEIDPEHSQTAYEHMARVQVHVVDQVFVVANTLSIESRERFEMFVSAARPMYSEDEILAIEQQVQSRG